MDNLWYLMRGIISPTDTKLFKASFENDLQYIKDHSSEINQNNIQTMVLTNVQNFTDEIEVLTYLYSLNLKLDLKYNNDQLFLCLIMRHKYNTLNYLTPMISPEEQQEIISHFNILDSKSKNFQAYNDFITTLDNSIDQIDYAEDPFCSYCFTNLDEPFITIVCNTFTEMFLEMINGTICVNKNYYIHRKCAFFCYLNRELKYHYGQTQHKHNNCQNIIDWKNCKNLIIGKEPDLKLVKIKNLIEDKKFGEAAKLLNITDYLYVDQVVIDENHCIICMTNEIEDQNILINFGCHSASHFMHLDCAHHWYLTNDKICTICKTPFQWEKCRIILSNAVDRSIQDEIDAYMS